MQKFAKIALAALLAATTGISVAAATEAPKVSFSFNTCNGPTETTQIGVVIACLARVGDADIKIYVPVEEVEKHTSLPKK